MRKLLKRFTAIVAVIAMTLALTVNVGAADETYTITINNSISGHVYEAYQIFTGDLSGSTLSNIQWGSGITEAGQTALGDAKTNAENLKTVSDANDFAKKVENYLTDTPIGSANTVTNGKYVIEGLSAGYYLIKDKDDSTIDAYTSYILKIIGNVEVKPKSAVPSIDKQVQDQTNDAEDGATNGWGETADHAINESFQFKLIATLPADENFKYYSAYKVVFYDTMSSGITFESIASVKIGDDEISETDYTYTATSGQEGGNWTLTIGNIKNHVTDLGSGTTIEVIYNAHLNERASVNKESGQTNNKNTVKLQYSNNPNGNGLGETTEDTVWVFTYEVDNTKVDGSTVGEDGKNVPLGGAGFKLYASNGDEIGLIFDDSISAYRPIKGEEESEEMHSNSTTGKFDIKGLDAGTYTLKETTTPSGYNTCADKEIIISATHIENANVLSATTTLSANSTMDNTIENNKGSTLPGTGGIGTYVFYGAGAILVMSAAAYFVTKRREANN